MKTFLSVIAGLLTGLLTVFIVDSISHKIYPLPEGLDFKNKEVLKDLMSKIPTGALVILISGWLLSAFLGGFVASKVNPLNWKTSALIVGSLLMLGAIANMFMIPHPVWMIAIAIAGYLPMAYLGGKAAAPGSL